MCKLNLNFKQYFEWKIGNEWNKWKKFNKFQCAIEKKLKLFKETCQFNYDDELSLSHIFSYTQYEYFNRKPTNKYETTFFVFSVFKIDQTFLRLLTFVITGGEEGVGCCCCKTYESSRYNFHLLIRVCMLMIVYFIFYFFSAVVVVVFFF